MRMGLALSVCASSSGPSGPPEDYVEDLIGLWRADTVVGGATPTEMTDLSGNGRHLIEVTGVTIGSTALIDGWGVAGKAIAVMDGGTQGMTAATAAPWKPLHTGAGATWWAILRSTADDVGTQTLFDTGPANSESHGVRVDVDGLRGRIGVTVYNGGGNGTLPVLLGPKWSWNGSFAMDAPHVVVVTFSTSQSPHYQVWLDDQLLESWSVGDRNHSDGVALQPSSSNPTGPINWGCTTSATQVWYGELAEMGASGSVVGGAQRRAIAAWASSEYGVTLTENHGKLIVYGNSMNDNAWKADQWPEISTPKLYRPVSKRMRAVAGLDAIMLLDKTAVHVAPDIDPSAPFNIVLSTECLNSIANGRTKEQAYTDFVASCEAIQALGVPLIVETVIPAGRVGLPLITQEKIDYFNTQLIANWASFADGLARPDLDPILGSWVAWDTDYDDGDGPGVYWIAADGIHLTAAGNALKEPYWTTAINTWLAANLDIPAPTLTSVSPSSGANAGSTALTLTGEDFIYGCTVTIGGAACTSVVHVSPTRVTCVSPAGTEGARDIVITNPDFQTDTLVGGYTYDAPIFDPATLSLTLWLKKNYTAAPWVGNASAGTSGSNDATTSTTDPSAASGDANFDGTDDSLLLEGTLDTYFNAGAWSFAVLFNADTAGAVGADTYEDNNLFSDGGGTFFAVGFNSSGVRTGVFSGGYVNTLHLACATGGWHLYQVKGNGTNMFHRLDSGAWTSIACGNIGGMTNQPFLGSNYSGKNFDGKVRAVFASDTVLSDANFDSIKSYVNATYGHAL